MGLREIGCYFGWHDWKESKEAKLNFRECRNRGCSKLQVLSGHYLASFYHTITPEQKEKIVHFEKLITDYSEKHPGMSVAQVERALGIYGWEERI